jgi:peptidoglycan/LPS O-acetylase OafA/YrhL
MRDTPFITRPLSILLDLVRVLAALAVLVGHAVQLGHYRGPYPFTMLFQHNAVIVFFVLSGLVIAASVDRGGHRLGDYAVARLSRFLPVALPALTISLAMVALDRMVTSAPLLGEDSHGVAPLEMPSALLHGAPTPLGRGGEAFRDAGKGRPGTPPLHEIRNRRASPAPTGLPAPI